MKLNQKVKLSIIFGIEFVAIAVILLLVFMAGKKSYTVTFDLNGGTLISGEVQQEIMQGKSATPPIAAKDGCYLHSWSGSYRQVTRDVVIVAVWEWETSVGFDYASSEDSNYCEITGCFKDLTGDVYVGVYHDEKKVLGIRDEAFKNCHSIENIHMLDGILSIGDNVFEGCEKLVSIELPGTLIKLGNYAFKDCVSLERIELPEGMTVLSEGTFKGCTSLKEVVLPSTIKTIERGAFLGCESLETIKFGSDLTTIKTDAFAGCTSLVEITIPDTVANIEQGAFNNVNLIIKTNVTEDAIPEGWTDGWNGESTVEWGVEIELPEEELEEEDKDDKKHKDNKVNNKK